MPDVLNVIFLIAVFSLCVVGLHYLFSPLKDIYTRWRRGGGLF